MPEAADHRDRGHHAHHPHQQEADPDLGSAFRPGQAASTGSVFLTANAQVIDVILPRSQPGQRPAPGSRPATVAGDPGPPGRGIRRPTPAMPRSSSTTARPSCRWRTRKIPARSPKSSSMPIRWTGGTSMMAGSIPGPARSIVPSPYADIASLDADMLADLEQRTIERMGMEGMTVFRYTIGAQHPVHDARRRSPAWSKSAPNSTTAGPAAASPTTWTATRSTSSRPDARLSPASTRSRAWPSSPTISKAGTNTPSAPQARHRGRYCSKRSNSLPARDAALDIGAGALNDSHPPARYRLRHVTALDGEPIAQEIADTLPADRFDYVIAGFEDFAFPAAPIDLLSAQYALPFIRPDAFDRVFAAILASLQTRRNPHRPALRRPRRLGRHAQHDVPDQSRSRGPAGAPDRAQLPRRGRSRWQDPYRYAKALAPLPFHRAEATERAALSYHFLYKNRQSPIFCDGTMAKTLAPSLELCKCELVRAARLSYLTRRPALRGKHARWSGWPAMR